MGTEHHQRSPMIFISPHESPIACIVLKLTRQNL